MNEQLNKDGATRPFFVRQTTSAVETTSRLLETLDNYVGLWYNNGGYSMWSPQTTSRLLPNVKFRLTKLYYYGTIVWGGVRLCGRRLLPLTPDYHEGGCPTTRPPPTQTTMRMQQEQEVDY